MSCFIYLPTYTHRPPGVRNSHFDKTRLFDRWLCCSAVVTFTCKFKIQFQTEEIEIEMLSMLKNTNKATNTVNASFLVSVCC